MAFTVQHKGYLESNEGLLDDYLVPSMYANHLWGSLDKNNQNNPF